ncbi:MAG TPA: hypothetical protein VHB99_01395 [Pirellulales bacterium]|nr:hypothetical protein [Pirellulales bacterium]
MDQRERTAKHGCANAIHALATIVAYGLIVFAGFPLVVILCFPDSGGGNYFIAAWGGMTAIGLACAAKSRGIAATVALVGSCSLILSWAIIARVVQFDQQAIFVGTSLPFFVIVLWFDYRFLTNLKRSDGAIWQFTIRDVGIVVLVVVAFVMPGILVAR